MCMSVGWGIFGFGNLLRFAAMRFAAQMVLSGLGSLQFVMIPVVSNFLLGDKYTWEAFISIVLILGGEQPIASCCAATKGHEHSALQTYLRQRGSCSWNLCRACFHCVLHDLPCVANTMVRWRIIPGIATLPCSLF